MSIVSTIAFPGDEFGYKLTVLVGRERVTGASFATAVPTKGSTGRFTIEKMIEFVEEVGDGSQAIVVKTDQDADAIASNSE